MTHIVSFKSQLSESSEFEHPRGYALCSFIQRKLMQAALDVSMPENYRDIAWSVDCIINSKKVFFFVGYLGTKLTDWQLIVCSGSGIISKILGHKDEEERLALANIIHEILSKDERFSDIKWYSRYADTPKDVWYEQPKGAKH